MLVRCDDKLAKNYGGRGITVCDRWRVFELFLEDMGEKPAGLTIDRKDNNGNYCKENCRWITPKQQGENKRNNRWIRVGQETRTMAQWSEITGIDKTTIYERIKRGWDEARAVTEKPKVTGMAVMYKRRQQSISP